MFIWNENETELINTAHISKFVISAPELAQKEWIVSAYIDFDGVSVMHRGTEESCKRYLARIAG